MSKILKYIFLRVFLQAPISQGTKIFVFAILKSNINFPMRT